jgi:hypothetical protein
MQYTPLEIVSKVLLAIRICQPLKGTWVKSVMLKPCGGLTNCMVDSFMAGLKFFFGPVISKSV